MALILTARWGEKVYVGNDIHFTPVRRKGDQVSVAVVCPRNLQIATESQRRKRERKAALKGGGNDNSQ